MKIINQFRFLQHQLKFYVILVKQKRINSKNEGKDSFDVIIEAYQKKKDIKNSDKKNK